MPTPRLKPRRRREAPEQEGLYIKQAAQVVGVTPAILRAWEAADLIKPARSASGFRLYTLADIVRLQQIRDLVRGRGVNVAGVREILDLDEAEPPAPSGAGVGERLRSLRTERGMSVRQLAAETGLSPSSISSMERSLHRPSVAALQKIASALGTNLVSLMDGGPSGPSSVVVKKRGRRRIQLDNPGVTIEQLAMVETQLEPLLFRMAPGATSGNSYTHEGEEFLYVLQGLFELTLDELTTYTLSEGDAMTFASVRPHRYRNPGSTETVIVWVNTPPTF